MGSDRHSDLQMRACNTEKLSYISTKTCALRTHKKRLNSMLKLIANLDLCLQINTNDYTCFPTKATWGQQCSIDKCQR